MTRHRPHTLSYLAALLLAAAMLLADAGCARPEPAPRERQVAERHPATAVHASDEAPAGELVSIYDLPSTWRDQSGEEVRLPDLRGGVRVMAMVYTSCQATCPLIVADLKRIESSLPAARRDDVRFVLVSLDPDRDTPGRLAQWAESTRLDPSRWTLLSGADDDVRELAATLDVRYQRQPDGEMAHTNAITVLDGEGAIVHRQVGLGDAAGETVDAVARLLR